MTRPPSSPSTPAAGRAGHLLDYQMPITSEMLEDKIFESMRVMFECAQVKVRFAGAGSAIVDGLKSSQMLGTVLIEGGLDASEAGTIYIKKTEFPGLADDEDFEILNGATWETRHCMNRYIKGNAVVAIEFSNQLGKNAR